MTTKRVSRLPERYGCLVGTMVCAELSPEDKDESDLRLLKNGHQNGVRNGVANGHAREATKEPRRSSRSTAYKRNLMDEADSDDEPLLRYATKRSRTDPKPSVPNKNGKVNGLNGHLNGINQVKNGTTKFHRHQKVIKEEPNDEIFFAGYPDYSLRQRSEDIETYSTKSSTDIKPFTTCCVRVAPNCTLDSTNPADYAPPISPVEACCKLCYKEINIPNSSMYGIFSSWRDEWRKHSRRTGTAREYIQDQILPYWFKCIDCTKFRSVPVQGLKENPPIASDVSSFKCGALTNTNVCNDEQDPIVEFAWRNQWPVEAKTMSLLQNSPVVHFLKNKYYLDLIGESHVGTFKVENDRTADLLMPFNMPEKPSIANCFSPDNMDIDEKNAFPSFKEQSHYLALRNLIVALWNINPFEYLKYSTCEHHMICHGISRIWYCRILRMAYDYLNTKCVINFGIIDIPRVPETLLQKKPRVLVIGAGISGLATARQLRSMGVSVTIIEAKDRVGGRMHDDLSLGVAVGKGAQLITGVINSPVALMCRQVKAPFKQVDDDCPLLDSAKGKVVDTVIDNLGLEHLNSVFDALAEYKTKARARKRIRRPKTEIQTTDAGEDIEYVAQVASSSAARVASSRKKEVPKKLVDQETVPKSASTTRCTDYPDVSLTDFITAATKQLKKKNKKWSADEERMLSFHIANTEFACGSTLDDVSALHWDQNEDVPQFSGRHACLCDGTGPIIQGLADGTDVLFNSPVAMVDCSGPEIEVTLRNGAKHHADKIVITVPLAVLKKGGIKFQPELPRRKKMAFEKIGAGLIEKVAVSFDTCFWSDLLTQKGEVAFFGQVPEKHEDRNLFNMFYDFSKNNSKNKKNYVLMSYVCGESVDVVNKMSDRKVAEEFVSCLRRMFPHKKVPAPTGVVVSHWGADEFIGMSYSYMRVGSSGVWYDRMASSVYDRIYFAGEATNRYFPQTMNGAYMSGLREAGKILSDCRVDLSKQFKKF